MATLDELQQQLASLSARVDALTTPPDDYYTSKYSGEEIDAGIAKTGSLPESWPLPIASGGTGADMAQLALSNLGARPSRNFADNSRFSIKQVVNQRGQITYTNGSIVASIDRWKLLGTMTLKETWITIQKTQEAPEFFVQTISDDVISALRGQTVTLSAIYNDGTRKIASSTFVVPLQGDIDSPEASIGDVLFDLYKSSGDANARIRFFSASPSTSLTLEAVELVLGDHQTIVYTDKNGDLQFIETPDYGEELARCQRHYVEGIVQAVVNPWPGLTFLGGTSFPVEMAKTPVLKIFTKKGGEENKVFDLNGNAQTPLVVETYPTTKGIKTIRLDGTLESTKSYSYYYTASTGM